MEVCSPPSFHANVKKFFLCPALPLHSPCPLAHCPTSSNTRPVYSSNHTCYRLLIPWTSLVYPQSCKHAFGFLFFQQCLSGPPWPLAPRGCTAPHLPNWYTSSARTLVSPTSPCSLSALFLTLAASRGHITAHREMQVQRDEVPDVAPRQQQMQCQVPRGFHSCRKRLTGQRGFIEEPGEPLKNLEVCLRERDFRSCSI